MSRVTLTASDKQELLEKLLIEFPDGVVSKTELKAWAERTGEAYPRWITKDPDRQLARGKYSIQIPVDVKQTPSPKTITSPTLIVGAGLVQQTASQADERGAFVPARDPSFEPFGFYNWIENIIRSGIFFPIYITGLSGNGKTLGVIEACARLGREMVRVNITKDTDELDLFGSYDLIDGNTVRNEGPVITAMKRGSILLLDETDYGTERILCLQSVLEGRPYLDKKTNTIVYPKPGFNVIATANTKGKGSSDGRFVGANVLNEAFLERFAITVEQKFPNEDVERKILVKKFKELGLDPKEDFLNYLIRWVMLIRTGFEEGSQEEVISTRRLHHIARAYSVFKNRKLSIELCINRFEEGIKEAFMSAYRMIDPKYDQDAKAAMSSEEKFNVTLDVTSIAPSRTTFRPVMGAPVPTSKTPQIFPPTAPQQNTSSAMSMIGNTRGVSGTVSDSERRAIAAELSVFSKKSVALNLATTPNILVVQYNSTNSSVGLKTLNFDVHNLPATPRDLVDFLKRVMIANP